MVFRGRQRTEKAGNGYAEQNFRTMNETINLAAEAATNAMAHIINGDIYGQLDQTVRQPDSSRACEYCWSANAPAIPVDRAVTAMLMPAQPIRRNTA